jgi:broad specificity phosphatase PhoE
VLDPYSGGESYVDVVARVRSFLGDLPSRYADRRICVIGHSATKWAFDHLLEGTSLEELVEGSFRWQPGWLYQLAIDG